MSTKKEITQNYHNALEIAKLEYESTLSRFKELDNKLNMLLVFAAGEIAAFGGTLSSFCLEYYCKLAYVIIFSAFLLVAVITTLFGLFTRSLDCLNTNNLNKNTSLEENEFINTYIEAYNKSINSIDKQIEKKCKIFNISLIFILVTLVIFSAFLIVDLLL